MTRKTKTRRRYKLTGGQTTSSDIVVNKHTKTINIPLAELGEEIKETLDKSKGKLNANDIATIIIAEQIAEELPGLQELVPPVKLEDSTNPVKELAVTNCSSGGYRNKKTKKNYRNKNSKNNKNSKKNNTRKLSGGFGGAGLLFVTLLMVVGPLVQAGISRLGVTEQEYASTTQQALSIGPNALTHQEGYNFLANDVGVGAGICTVSSALASGIITTPQFEDGVVQQALYVSGFGEHIGNTVSMSQSYSINFDVTDIVMPDWKTNPTKSIQKGLDAVQQNMIQDRKISVDNGSLQPNEWASSMFSISGHALSASVTPTGALLVKNGNVAPLSALDRIGPSGYYVTYRPPIEGMTVESTAEWNRLNSDFNGNLGKTVGQDTVTKYVTFATKDVNDSSLLFAITGVTGNDNKPSDAQPTKLINNRRNVLAKKFNAAGEDEHLRVTNYTPYKTNNGLVIDRYKVDNTNAVEVPIDELKANYLDVHAQSAAAALAKSQYVNSPEDEANKGARKVIEKTLGYPITRLDSTTN